MTTHKIKTRAKRLIKKCLYHPALGPLLLKEYVSLNEVASTHISDMQVLYPTERITFATESDSDFLSVCKYYNDGAFVRPNVFVCRLQDSYLHVGTGLVCTQDFRAISDSVLEYRLPYCRAFGRYKPRNLKHLSGNYSTIHNVFGSNHWHWLVDSLPRVYSLMKAAPDERITILLPEAMTQVQRDSLECVLPPNFVAKFLPTNSWVKPECLVLPSLVTGRANGYLPAEYSDYLRRSVFSKLGLSLSHKAKERIYISRSGAQRRRILNEDKVIDLLSTYGFKSYELEKLTFKEQVELFHQAEFVVGPNGAGLGNILFSGKISILVLYPDKTPNTYFLTQAKSLGQEHFFLADKKGSEHLDFEVNITDLESILRGKWGLEKTGS
jgi:hypothetical protein